MLIITKFPPTGRNEPSLAEFAPAGAKKMGSFSPATCAAEKIPLAERSVELPAQRATEARSEAHPLVRMPASERSEKAPCVLYTGSSGYAMEEKRNFEIGSYFATGTAPAWRMRSLAAVLVA